MAGFYDAIDLYFSYEGDWHIDQKGDLQDTSFDYLRAINQYILNIVKSDRSDWKYRTSIGANTSSFVGQPNTRENARALRDRIVSSLISHNEIKINDLQVSVLPISAKVLSIRIQLDTVPTKNNGNTNKLTLNFTYDYGDNNVTPIRGEYNKV